MREDHQTTFSFLTIKTFNLISTISQTNSSIMKYLVALALFATFVACAMGRPQEEVTLLRSEDERKEDGSFNWAYELSDGSKADQKGYIKNPEEPDQDKRIQVLEGSFTYIQDGAPISVTYTADENGFQPKGDHLPTAPPTPDHVLKLLEIINANAAQQRKRSAGRF